MLAGIKPRVAKVAVAHLSASFAKSKHNVVSLKTSARNATWIVLNERCNDNAAQLKAAWIPNA